MGGGGGSDYEAIAASQEAKRQKARDALNQVFGVAPTGGAPTQAQFTSQGTSGGVDPNGNPLGAYPTLDQPGYDAAVAEYQNSGVEAGKNKTARDALYQSIRDNAFGAGRMSLDDNFEKAARDNKFALFAQGLNGGSVDLDENALLKRTQDRGLLDIGAKADATKADIMGSDEQTRLGLLQSIDAGMDQGSALSSALGQLKVNSDRASADAQGTTIGDLFADSGLLYTKSQAARGRQAANDWWATNYPQKRSPSQGSGGIISSRGG